MDDLTQLQYSLIFIVNTVKVSNHTAHMSDIYWINRKLFLSTEIPIKHVSRHLLALIDFLYIFQFCFKPAKHFKEFFWQHSSETRSVHHTVKTINTENKQTVRVYCEGNFFPTWIKCFEFEGNKCFITCIRFKLVVTFSISSHYHKVFFLEIIIIVLEITIIVHWF